MIEGPLRIVTLDSSRYPEPGGSLDPEQLEWLDRTLARRPDQPTVVAVHHPPFATGIAHMDTMALDAASAAGLAAVIAGHPQVERVLVRPPAPPHQPALRRHHRHDRAGHRPRRAARPRRRSSRRGTASRRRSCCTSGRPSGGVVTHLEVIGDHHPVSFGI